MSPRVPTIDDDLIDAVREDDIESTIAEARERLGTCDEQGGSFAQQTA